MPAFSDDCRERERERERPKPVLPAMGTFAFLVLPKILLIALYTHNANLFVFSSSSTICPSCTFTLLYDLRSTSLEISYQGVRSTSWYTNFLPFYRFVFFTMPCISRSALRHCWACVGSLQFAETQLDRAKRLMATQDREHVEAALVPLDTALENEPHCEEALELKARALLYLGRFKDVVEMLHEYLPKIVASSSQCGLDGKAEVGLCLDMVKTKHKTYADVMKGKRQKWRFLVLGQVCCHLGMMEEAMVLLQSGKHIASLSCRRASSRCKSDRFDSQSMMARAESDLVNNMLASIKLLLHRKTAGKASFEAGLYSESVKHFSKILEGKKGTPPKFIADCYVHRAAAYQAMGKVVNAIADCNKSLSLNPGCATTLSLRASVYGAARCYGECLLDLNQLKMIHEAAIRCPDQSQWASNKDIIESLGQINTRIHNMQQNLMGTSCLDAHAILDVSPHCTMEAVEKAFLLISLRHSPEKAVQFLELCDHVDGRDIDIVREEACASAFRLAHVVLKAYTKLLSSLSEELSERKRTVCKMEYGIRSHPKCGIANALPTTAEGEEEMRASDIKSGLQGSEPRALERHIDACGGEVGGDVVDEGLVAMVEGKDSPCTDTSASEASQNTENKLKPSEDAEVVMETFATGEIKLGEDDVVPALALLSTMPVRVEQNFIKSHYSNEAFVVCSKSRNGGLSSSVLADALSQALSCDGNCQCGPFPCIPAPPLSASCTFGHCHTQSVPIVDVQTLSYCHT